MATDHLGNEFPTKTALCEHYRTTSGRVARRLSKGWSFEEALTVPKVSPSKAGKMGRDASGWGRGNEILLGSKR